MQDKTTKMEGTPRGENQNHLSDVSDNDALNQQWHWHVLQRFLLSLRVYGHFLRRKCKNSPLTWKGVGAFLTGLATIVGTVVAVFMFLSGDGSEITSLGVSAPTRLSATLSEVIIDDVSVSLGDFCDRRELTCDQYGEIQRQWPGIIITYAIAVEGYEGQQLSLSWSIYATMPRSRLNDPALVEQPGWPDGIYTAEATTDRNVGEIWVPYPTTRGEFFVRIELYPPSRVRLDAVDSESFTV